MKKIFWVFVVTIALCLTGCGTEIDDVSYVVAIGVDESEAGYNFTFAIGNPNSINGGGEGGGGDNNVLIYENAVAKDVFAAGDMVESRIGQRVNFSHAELLLISEAVAKQGVSELSDGLVRNLNQRPKLVPAACLTSAKEALESINSDYDGNPEKQLKKMLEEETSPVSLKVDNRDFLCRTKNIDSGCAIPLISSTDKGLEVSGISVFYKGKLIGSISDILSYKLLADNVKNLSYSIDGIGSVILNQTEKPKISVECGRLTKINVDMKISVTVASLKDGKEKQELYGEVKSSLEKRIYELMQYTKTTLGVDALEFYRYGKKSFKTEKSWQEYNWYEKYKNAEFEVNVEIIPEKTGLVGGAL